MRLKNLRLKLRVWSPFRYTATKCGHRTKQTGNITAFGRTIIISMPKNKKGSVDYCLECIGKMTIQCAWCRNPIFIGNPITLYSPGPHGELFFSSEEPSEVQKERRDGDFIIPDHAIAYSENPPVLVGCLRMNCADTGADRAGFWMPGEDGKGAVQRVPTVYELMLGTEGKSMMLIGDTHDIVEAMNPTLVPHEAKKIG